MSGEDDHLRSGVASKYLLVSRRRFSVDNRRSLRVLRLNLESNSLAPLFYTPSGSWESTSLLSVIQNPGTRKGQGDTGTRTYLVPTNSASSRFGIDRGGYQGVYLDTMASPSSPPSKTFLGWVAHDVWPKNPLTFTTFEPKPFTDTDIEIKVTHCGVCGSELHTLRSGWGPTNYPCVVGHEIVGTVVRVGSAVPTLASSPAARDIKVGDRVGVGAQSASCLRPDCDECQAGIENMCSRFTGTYNGKYADGSKSQGGYAMHWRGPAHFVFKIPDALPSAAAAPLLCGGITSFSPLLNNGAGPGKSVGIVGIGGLGHMGILFAKALNCDRVVAISRTSSKRDDALNRLGADDYIATDEDQDWAKKHSRSLDLIVSTVSSAKMPLNDYLRLLKVNGTFVQIGLPEEPMPAFTAWPLTQKGIKITGSNIGSPAEIRKMLELAAEKKILPWVQERPMSDVNNVLLDMAAGKARYRYVLVNDSEAESQAKL